MAEVGELVQQGHDLGAAAAVEGARGFVGEDDMAAVHQGAGDGYALLLAAGELVGSVLQALAQAQAGEQGGGALAALLGRGAGIDGGDLDVFPRRGRGNQVVALEDEAERLAAQPGELVVVEVGDVLAGETVAAFAGAVQAAEDVHQGGFARARGADDGDELAGADGQGHAAQHLGLGRAVVAAVTLADAVEMDQRFAHAQLSPAAGPTSRRSPSSRPDSTWMRRRSRMPVRTSRSLALPPLSSTRAW
ncbi:hypothetical protein D3C84_434150 [compost metagenome]